MGTCVFKNPTQVAQVALLPSLSHSISKEAAYMHTVGSVVIGRPRDQLGHTTV